MTQPRKSYRFGVEAGLLYHETTIDVEPSPKLAAVAPRLALAHAQRAAEGQVVADVRRIVSGRRA